MIAPAVGEWPKEDRALKALKRSGFRNISVVRKCLIPYFRVSYELESSGGSTLGGVTAINATLAPYPKGLSEAIPLIRPLIPSMECSNEPVSGDIVLLPQTTESPKTFLEEIVWWLSELEKELEPTAEKLRKMHSTMKRSILIPMPPGIATAERRISDSLARLVAQREAIALLFGLSRGETIESISVLSHDLVYHRTLLAVSADGVPLVTEVDPRGKTVLDRGLLRLIQRVPEAADPILKALEGSQPGGRFPARG